MLLSKYLYSKVHWVPLASVSIKRNNFCLNYRKDWGFVWDFGSATVCLRSLEQVTETHNRESSGNLHMKAVTQQASQNLRGGTIPYLGTLFLAVVSCSCGSPISWNHTCSHKTYFHPRFGTATLLTSFISLSHQKNICYLFPRHFLLA